MCSNVLCSFWPFTMKEDAFYTLSYISIFLKPFVTTDVKCECKCIFMCCQWSITAFWLREAMIYDVIMTVYAWFIHDMPFTSITPVFQIDAVSAVDNNMVNTRNIWDNLLSSSDHWLICSNMISEREMEGASILLLTHSYFCSLQPT